MFILQVRFLLEESIHEIAGLLLSDLGATLFQQIVEIIAQFAGQTFFSLEQHRHTELYNMEINDEIHTV